MRLCKIQSLYLANNTRKIFNYRRVTCPMKAEDKQWHKVIIANEESIEKENMLLLFKKLFHLIKSLEVFSPALTTRKKVVQNENQQLFLDLSRNCGSRTDYSHENRRDRKAQTENQSLVEEKPRSRSLQLGVVSVWTL